MVLIPEDVANAQVEDDLGTIKALGRVRVRGRTISLKLDSHRVLCESKEMVDPSKVLPELLPEGKTKSWRIVIASESHAPPSPLKSLLEETQESGSAESIIRAVGDLLTKMGKPSGENSSYRRLRVFSGTVPTPVGEESLEHWLEHAHLMVEESECSNKEQRRRIMESLKGPALAVVKAVRNADPEVSPAVCLEAIDSAFGSAETGEDLYFAFRLLKQQPKEKMSDFLRRIELSLTKVVRRGGLPTSRTYRARVEQLLRGAIHADMMLVQLKLRDRKENPPSFLELLSEIRREEEYESSRMKLNTSVRSVHTTPTTDSRQDDVERLRTEIQELKSMFTAMSTLPSQVVADRKRPEAMTKMHTPAISNREEKIKPVLRLTYDEPGKASEQPITIVHRGVTITIGKN
ncbi:paraneoplastic antigen Ma1 homolog [Xyrauchen texanus]|uniref:paraneoplastic antigen Ma1 homolog n=1 Tax=Xyrauchen texanus TaxID=154827 RepID=UPI002242BB3B|nr:paraneoplastic antigen Ma1 homolog [Xyrauchen texanus]